MKIDNQFEVAAPQAEAWAALIDPARVARCIPGCVEVAVLSPTAYKATMLVEVGVIKTRFKLDIAVTRTAPLAELNATIKGEEGSRASTVRADVALRLAALDADRTSVEFSAEVIVAGRLGKFGLGMMKKKADTVGAQFAESFRALLESAEAAT